MLVLTRKSEQSVIIGRSIEVKILGVHGDQVSLGFSAPDEVSIYRKEVYEAVQRQNLQAIRHGNISLKILSDALTNMFPVQKKETSQAKGGMQGKKDSTTT